MIWDMGSVVELVNPPASGLPQVESLRGLHGGTPWDRSGEPFYQ
jgi:hypothetical protein